MAEQIAQFLLDGASADRAKRITAEAALKQAKQQQGFPQVLLQLCRVEGHPSASAIHLLAAVHLKNVIKGHWEASEENDIVLHDADKAFIKENLLQFMLMCQDRVQAQLAECLTIISSHELKEVDSNGVPTKWPQLIPNLAALLNTKDLNVGLGVLSVAHSIFKGFRHQFQSDQLFSLIKFVITHLGNAFLEMFELIVQAISQPTTPETLAATVRAALLATKVFHDLNHQELAEFFEDNIKRFMDGFHQLLVFQHPSFAPQPGADSPTPQIELHASVCEVLNLYVEKYDEEFGPYLGPLLSDVWQLLIKCGQQPPYDPLVITACRFLTTVLTGTSHTLLQSPDTLKQICQSIVIPNIQLRDEDEDMFESDPEEFIRKDIEGSDLETRRRAAHDLVKGLLKYFEPQVTSIFTEFITMALGAQFDDETKYCRAKDSCMFLVTAITAKGTTAALGATDTNKLVNINEFFLAHVIPELQSDPEEKPLLKAAALKFTATFRSQLPPQMTLDILKVATSLLKSSNEVVYTYAANLIEKVLGLRDGANQPRFTTESLSPISGPLLAELFAVLERDGIQENDYVIKAILRIVRIMQEAMATHVEMCISRLKGIVHTVCQNPKKPIFNHYLFECIACLVKSIVKVQPAAADAFEGILFDSFQKILNEDVADFVPYVFQMMTLLLSLRPQPIPPLYMSLLPSFLNESLYHRPGNVPPLTALLRSFLQRAPDQVVAAGQLPPLLGVFQFLVSKRAHDHDGLLLLMGVFDFVELKHYQPMLPTVMQILLTRLQKSPTTKFERNLCLALLCFIAKHGGNMFFSTLEGIQPGLATMVTKHVIVRRLTQLTSAEDKRLAAVGCTRLLCETSAMISTPANFEIWPALLVELVKALEANLTAQHKDQDDEADMATVEQTAVSGQPGQTYSKLQFAALKRADSYAVLPANKEFLVRSLATLSQQNPGRIAPAIASQHSPEVDAWLQAALAACGASLA